MTDTRPHKKGRAKGPPADVIISAPDQRLLKKAGGMIAPLPPASRLTLEYRIELLTTRFLPEYITMAAELREVARQPDTTIAKLFDLAHDLRGFGVNAGQRASGDMCKALCDLIDAFQPNAPPRNLVCLLAEAIYTATQTSTEEAEKAAATFVAVVQSTITRLN